MPVTIQPKNLAEVLNRAAAEVREEWQEDVLQEVEFENTLAKRYCKNTYAENKREVTDVLQPYLGDFAPKTNISVTSHENKLEIGQLDMNIEGTQMLQWFNTMYPQYVQAGKDPLSNEFLTKFINTFVLNQVKRELNHLSFSGVKAVRTAGTSAAFATTFDGFDKILSDLVTANKVGKIVTGTIDSTNIEEKVQFAMEQIPAKFRFNKGKIYMSRTMATRYSKRYKLNHTWAAKVENDPTGRQLMVDDYDVTIDPKLCMEGANYFIIDMENDGETNLIIGNHDEVPALPVLRFEADKRNVAVMAEIYRFYGLRRTDYTFITAVA